MSTRCQPDSGPKSTTRQTDPRSVELPILPDRPKIRKSRVGPWRAGVLIAVHVAIAAHFVHWWTSGRTMTPLEPSESMEFSTQGVVNAGFVLFVLAIGSTAILGRWFCGWACHIVALQDLCRWMLGKIGMTPRLVDLGPLRAVPWLAFVYMFLAPLADRALVGIPLGVSGTQFTTEDLWRTFPNSWPEAIATLLVVGFVIVWLLGSKGFCTYGCPYGGIFGVADQVAPMRIRVTDACEGCGHCTAVCTSNVNVSREVREYGAVVDAGCMKCLDCVSVCPNDALYVGFGAPAMLAKPKPDVAAKRSAAPKPAFDWGRLVLSAAFSFAALSIFLWHDGTWDLRLTTIIWAFSFAAMWVFRGKARGKPDHTLLEEVAIAAVFLLAMSSFRGLFDGVPFLFALGISAILGWWSVELARMFYKPDVRMQKTALKRAGRWTLAGGVFALTAVPIAWLGLSGFREQRDEQAERERVRAEQHAAHERAVAEYNRGVSAAQAGRIDEAIGAFQAALDIDPRSLPARENLAGMLCAAGRLEEGLAQYEIAIAQNPADAENHALAARASVALQRLPTARAHLEEAVRLAPENVELWRMLADVQQAMGDAAAAQQSRARAQALEPRRQ
jgi:Tfp pilus assembly protein PilF/ferredoxin